MQRFIQDPLKALKDLFHAHEGVFSIVLILVLVLLGFWYNNYQKNQQRKPMLSIDAADVTSLSVGRTQQLYAFLDSDGNGPREPEDVTSKAEWTTSNTSVGFVGNTSIGKGLFTAVGPGQVGIAVSYNGMQGAQIFSIDNASLAIHCVPFVKKAKVGASVGFITVYDKTGTPDYAYQWQTPDGAKSKEVAPYFRFTTKGEKIVTVKVTDRGGAKAEASCEPVVIE